MHATLLEKFLRYSLFLFILRIIHCDGMPAEHTYNLHARHISLTITHINHLSERNPLLVLRHTLIDLLGIPRAENSLVYLEKKLRLCRIIHSDAWPLRLALRIIQERTRENVLELLGDRAALDDLLQP